MTIPCFLADRTATAGANGRSKEQLANKKGLGNPKRQIESATPRAIIVAQTEDRAIRPRDLMLSSAADRTPMADLSPYQSPAPSRELAEPLRPPTRRQLWRGYLIAPLVAPLAAALIIFAAGLLLSDRESTGTPIGIILLPILLMTVGVVISYLLALLIGMPVAFLLHKNNLLNGYTIHLAALILAVVVSLLLTLLGVMADDRSTALRTLYEFGFSFLIIAPFVLATSTVFWWVGVRGHRNPNTDLIET